MTTLVLNNDPAAADIQVHIDTLTVILEDERQISVPLSWYPRLLAGTEAERNNWELLREGYAIMWPSLASISVSKDCLREGGVRRSRSRSSGG